MTNQQLYFAVGVPLLLNTLFFGILIAYINTKIAAMNTTMETRFAAINQRFDDMRDLWRAELRRVEEILDARLKHLEERLG